MRVKPTEGELRAATIIATGYRKVLAAIGHPDELGQLPQEIERVAKIIAANRDAAWVDPYVSEEADMAEGRKP